MSGINLAWFDVQHNTELLARKRVDGAVERVLARLALKFGGENLADACGVDPDLGQTIDSVRGAWVDVIAALTPEACQRALVDARALDECPSYDDFRDLAAVYAVVDTQSSTEVVAPAVRRPADVLPVSSDTPNLWAWRLCSATAARNLIHFYTGQKMRMHSAAVKHHLEVTRKLVMRDGVLCIGSGGLFMR